jgi:hypothetical protein
LLRGEKWKENQKAWHSKERSQALFFAIGEESFIFAKWIKIWKEGKIISFFEFFQNRINLNLLKYHKPKLSDFLNHREHGE